MIDNVQSLKDKSKNFAKKNNLLEWILMKKILKI